MNAACAQVLVQAEFRSVLTDSGGAPADGDAAAFAGEIAAQAAANGRVVQAMRAPPR